MNRWCRCERADLESRAGNVTAVAAAAAAGADGGGGRRCSQSVRVSGPSSPSTQVADDSIKATK